MVGEAVFFQGVGDVVIPAVEMHDEIDGVAGVEAGWSEERDRAVLIVFRRREKIVVMTMTLGARGMRERSVGERGEDEQTVV